MQENNSLDDGAISIDFGKLYSAGGTKDEWETRFPESCESADWTLERGLRDLDTWLQEIHLSNQLFHTSRRESRQTYKECHLLRVPTAKGFQYNAWFLAISRTRSSSRQVRVLSFKLVAAFWLTDTTNVATKLFSLLFSRYSSIRARFFNDIWGCSGRAYEVLYSKSQNTDAPTNCSCHQAAHGI